MREPTVMFAHSPRGWAKALHLHLMDHGGATMRGYVVGSHDALAEPYDVLVVDDVTSFLTPSVVDDLHLRGSRILGVFDPEEADGAGKRRLVELGVDEVVALDSGASWIAATIAQVAGEHRIEDEVDGLRAAIASDPTRHQVSAPLIAVAGAGGGVGATEIALQLAITIGRAGKDVALVDVDDVGPALAQRLRLPVSPNLRTAVDVRQQRHAEVSDAFQPGPINQLNVLVGLPSHRLWAGVRSGDVLAVLADVRKAGRTVVANVGPHIGAGSSETRSRFDLARSVVASASSAIVVGLPNPVGCRRIVDWLADVATVDLLGATHVVVNQHGSRLSRTSEIARQLRQRFAVDSVTIAPTDSRIAAQVWTGGTRASRRFQKAMRQVALAAGVSV